MAKEEEAGVKVKVKFDDKGLPAFEKKIKKSIETARKEAESELKKLQEAQRKTAEEFRSKLGGAAKDVGHLIVGSLRTGAVAATAGSLAMVHSNMDSEKSFRRVAFAMRAGGSQAAQWNAMQQKSFALTKRWGGTNEELARGLGVAFEKSGDADFATKSMDALAMASTASVGEMEDLGAIAGELNSKFGVTASEMPDALGIVATLAAKGGQSVNELASEMDALGKSTKAAGIQGMQGFSQMVALSQKMADAAGGETAAMGMLSKVLAKINSDQKLRSKLKASGVNMSGSSIDVLQSLMQKTKGDPTKLGQFMASNAASVLSEGLGPGGFDEALKAAQDAMQNHADIQKEAASAAESTEKRVQRAMATIAERFAAPDAMNAIERLTAALPKFADVVVGAVDLVSKHPYLAGGAAAVGLAGAPTASAVSSIAGIIASFRKAQAAQSALESAQAANAAATTGATASVGAMAAKVGVAVVAIAAWAAALDQWNKLTGDGGDLPTYRSDQEQQRQNAIQARITSGQYQEGSVTVDNGVGGQDELFVTGKDKTGQFTYLNQLEAMKKYGSLDAARHESYNAIRAFSGAKGGYDFENAQEKRRQQWESEQPKSRTTINDVLNKKPPKPGEFRWGTPQESPKPQGTLNANAKILESLPQRLAAQELKVRVVNPDDIRGKKGESIFGD